MSHAWHKLATLSTDLIRILMIKGHGTEICGFDARSFGRKPIHVFALEGASDRLLTALVLSTQDEIIRLAQSVASWQPDGCLSNGEEAAQIAFVPNEQMGLGSAIFKTLNEAVHGLVDKSYVQHNASGIICAWRYDPADRLTWHRKDTPIPVYCTPDGFVVQLDSDYQFALHGSVEL